ncbi:GDSL-type esterase/lipase family protein [Sporosarcina sp. HYO08]|uniref:GDSL-type esterase/lipase family protein n=1 Tax=Sporosarcina sp. HYO08 TaxID=1759557 RepID=UPI0007932F55|nr:GDSL-type esterase/lipase family protein [Sporosarcina sp. HYO08]KXH81787.1 GDSL family lipase [Sporosarcina sp. HYO08]
MRRIIVLTIVFSFLLASCSAPSTVKNDVVKRENTAFGEWDIPNYFIPKKVHVVGLGDSLTQGVGDERKKGGYFGRVSHRMESWKGVEEIQADNLSKRGRRSDQLIDQLESPEIQAELKKADVIYLTIGGNDLMKVMKANLFDLKMKPFYIELGKFENRLDEIFTILRALNGDAIIVVAGLYNPFTIVMDEVKEFDDILEDWNTAIEGRAMVDGKTCFVPVIDLFDSNANMVYHTDFFHPNAKGYDLMANRFLDQLQACGLEKLSDGELEM